MTTAQAPDQGTLRNQGHWRAKETSGHGMITAQGDWRAKETSGHGMTTAQAPDQGDWRAKETSGHGMTTAQAPDQQGYSVSQGGMTEGSDQSSSGGLVSNVVALFRGGSVQEKHGDFRATSPGISQQSSWGKFDFQEENVTNGRKFLAFHDGAPLSYHMAMTLMQQEHSNFLSEFLRKLRHGVGYKAYFFETPPVTREQAGHTQFEFVLIDAPSMYKIHTDESSFAEHFRKQRVGTIVTFENLGRDSLLVAPCPFLSNVTKKKSNNHFAHLATFVREGNEVQVNEFWKVVAEKMLDRLRSGPGRVWLSTSGLGIYWLHVRMDSYPKYYTYQPYKQ